jgi:hypothetical protein
MCRCPEGREGKGKHNKETMNKRKAKKGKMEEEQREKKKKRSFREKPVVNGLFTEKITRWWKKPTNNQLLMAKVFGFGSWG